MKKVLLWGLITAVVLLCLSGCGGESTSVVQETEASESVPASKVTAPESVEAEEPEEPVESSAEAEPEPVLVTYPLTEENITLTFFAKEYPGFSGYLENADWNNQIVLQEAEKITGVNIDFIAIPVMTLGERYSLSFASGDLPDIYYWAISQYTKGPDSLITDDICIRLNELIDEYAPNYKAARERSEDIMRQTISDEGNIVSFYVLNTENVYSGMGFMTRQDLLDEAGLDVPVTYDDWYEMLTAYQNMGVAIPTFSIGDMGGLFFGGYGFDYNWISFMNNPYYQIDGAVQFSPYAENFKLMLETCNKWYSEGLVVEDFYNMHDLGETQGKEFAGEVGVWTAYVNAVNLFNDNTTIPGASSVAIPNPVLSEEDQIHISTSTSVVGNDCGAISTDCEYPELAVQWLDFWYSEQGSELVNYGVEGVTFEYDSNGEPQYTDMILNNPDGLTIENVQSLYLGYCFPGLVDPTALLDNYTEAQWEALEVWTSNVDDEWNFPVGAAMTAEEAEEYSAIYSDISSYLAEQVTSFVVGARTLDTFDEFIETLESMNVERCIELQQAALDRYYSKSLS